MTQPLPPPPIPADVDLTDFPYMPLQIARLRRSKAWLVCKRQPELAFYMINLWTAAWHEVPAGSLEDDDDVLADRAMCDPEKWGQVRGQVLRGWVKCSDGRLYHPVVAERVLEAWAARTAGFERTLRARMGALRKRMEQAKTDKARQRMAEELASLERTLSLTQSQKQSQDQSQRKTAAEIALLLKLEPSRKINTTDSVTESVTFPVTSEKRSRSRSRSRSEEEEIDTHQAISVSGSQSLSLSLTQSQSVTESASDFVSRETETRTKQDICPPGDVNDPAYRVLERVMPIYPARAGTTNWPMAAHYIGVRLQEGETEDSLIAAVERYSSYATDEEIVGTRYVMDPSTFFSRVDRPWQQTWKPSLTKAEQRLAGNVDAIEQARRELFGGES